MYHPVCLSSSRPDGFDFLYMWQGWIRHLTSPEHSKSSSEGCPRIGDAHPVILVIPSYAPWKQISNLLTLASTQHGNTLRIENNGSTSWKPLRSCSGLARDDDEFVIMHLFYCYFQFSFSPGFFRSYSILHLLPKVVFED